MRNIFHQDNSLGDMFLLIKNFAWAAFLVLIFTNTQISFAQNLTPQSADSNALEPKFKIPSLSGFPSFANIWRQEIQNESTKSGNPFHVHSQSLEIKNEENLPADFVNQNGALLVLVLEAGSGSKELRVWMRLLRDLYPVLDSSSLAPPFRRAFRLNETPLKEPLKEEGLGVGDFINIEISKSAPPWGKQLCQTVVPWIHTIQLLSGRTQQAENSRKEALTLQCKLRHFAELDSLRNFIQLATWPLPYQDPKTKAWIFKNPNDLYSTPALQRLQKLK